MRVCARLLVLVLAPVLAQAVEIRVVLVTPAIEGVLQQIWSDAGRGCKPRSTDEQRLYEAVLATLDPATRLESLESWVAAYPDSPGCEAQRIWLTALAHAQAGNAECAAEVGQGLLSRIPPSLERRFTLAWLAPGRARLSKAELREVDETAAALLKTMASSQFRPAPIDGITGSEIRDAVELVAHVAAGLVANANRDWSEAQVHFRHAKRIMPQSAFLSYHLGAALLGLGDPEQNDDALRAFAFAAEHRGSGALSESDRLAVRDYLQKVWRNYSGRPYEDLLEAVREKKPISASPEVVAGRAKLHILTDRRPTPVFPQPYWKSLLLDHSHPSRTVFYDLWSALVDAPSGDEIWDELEGKLTPRMELQLLQAEPSDQPQNLALGVGEQVFVAVELSEPLSAPLPMRRWVEFEGIAVGFQRDPFLLTLEKGRIE